MISTVQMFQASKSFLKGCLNCGWRGYLCPCFRTARLHSLGSSHCRTAASRYMNTGVSLRCWPGLTSASHTINMLLSRNVWVPFLLSMDDEGPADPPPHPLKKHRQTLRHQGSPTHRHPPGYISLESARPSSPRINSWIFSRRCEDEWNFSEVFLFLIDSMTNNLFPVCYERIPPCRDAHTVFSYLF